MKKTKQILLTTIMLLGVVLAQAQTATSASGGEATGSGGTLSYTVGQASYQSHTGSGGTLSEGVQQPYEIFMIGINNAPNINIDVLAYPNPTSDYLQLKVEFERLKDLSYQIFDMNGKLLQNKKIASTETQINMSNYVSATYFVKVISENKQIKEFKIIKN